MTISVTESFLKNGSNCPRRRLVRRTGRSRASIQWMVKTDLDVSMAMRLYWVTDGSGLGCSQPQFWHLMPWGRPPQQSASQGGASTWMIEQHRHLGGRQMHTPGIR